MAYTPSPIFTPSGYLRLGTIKSVDVDTMSAKVFFRDSIIGTDSPVDAQLPISYISSGGGFIGGFVAEGTPVIVGQAESSGQYFIVSFLARDPTTKVNINTAQLPVPELDRQHLQLVIQSNTDGSISFNEDAITIGEPINSVVFDTTRKIKLNSFDSNYDISQAGKHIVGAIKRDRRPTNAFTINASFLRDIDPAYDDGLKVIGMDPIAAVNNTNTGKSVRNPARVENREVVLEYEALADVQANDEELKGYNTNNNIVNSSITARRESRADALSLSLVSPNYLMETIKGTVVDIFGNLVDLNRDKLSIGVGDLSISKIKSSQQESNTFKNVYEQIKRLERKSLAFHFEINARKELGGSGAPDISDRDNNARDRARFSVDIDKEGQIKINVPASSETGNIGLLTRQENYSTVHPNSASGDPNDLSYNDDYTDILIEQIGIGVINLKDENGNIIGPIDRFSGSDSPEYIKLGTMYHDISKTVNTVLTSDFYTPVEYVPTTPLGLGQVKGYDGIVSTEIVVAGEGANGGGRSATVNLDGMLVMNIGANSVDRQSMWLDTEGSIISNVGADSKTGLSWAGSFDGGIILQVGGSSVGNDVILKSRVFDLRVFNSVGEATILRIDENGCSISTPTRLLISANGGMNINSLGRLSINSPQLYLNGRNVAEDPGHGII